MRPKARFIKSVIETAKACDTTLPWTRSARQAKRAVGTRRQRRSA